MFEKTNLNEPKVLKEIELATRDIGYFMASDKLTESLLRTLVSSKPGGRFLELGTGTGMGTAWLLDGMDQNAHLTSIDNNEETTAIARRFLGQDPRVTFLTIDGDEFIRSNYEQQDLYDLIFADAEPGKIRLLNETLTLLNKGGIYIIADLNVQPSWSKEYTSQVDNLIKAVEQRPDLNITKLNWSTGLIIATKR